MTSNGAAIKAGHKLTITHEFDAPRALVWEAWTKREHLANWWGPEDFTNPKCEIDVRPGGRISIDMRGPDGVVYPMSGSFREVREPELLVFATTPLDAAGETLFEVLNTVRFTADGDRTALTLTAEVVWASDAAAIYLSGMEEGWKQSFNKLSRQLRSQQEII